MAGGGRRAYAATGRQGSGGETRRTMASTKLPCAFGAYARRFHTAAIIATVTSRRLPFLRPSPPPLSRFGIGLPLWARGFSSRDLLAGGRALPCLLDEPSTFMAGDHPSQASAVEARPSVLRAKLCSTASVAPRDWGQGGVRAGREVFRLIPRRYSRLHYTRARRPWRPYRTPRAMKRNGRLTVSVE